MAAGIPVISSNSSARPEVCGEAAEYINPEDQINIQDTIVRLLDDEEKKKILIERGFQ